MSLITIASSSVTANVLSGTVMMPLVGVWTADIVIDQPDGTGFDAGAEVTITAGEMELRGSVAADRTGSFLDAVHVRVLGGKGGMTKPASLQSYVQPSAFARDVVNGLMTDSGETLSDTADAGFLGGNLTAWAVMNGLVSQAVEMLLFIVAPEKHWRILSDGKFWIGDESWDEVSPTVEVIESNPSERTTVLGVDAPTIVPGVTLQGVGMINRVEHSFKSGKVRSQVWTEIEGEQRGVVAQIQSLVRQEIAGIDYQALYLFKVVSQSSDLLTVDVNPIEPNDKRLHGLSSVPVRMGSAVKVQFVQGASVLLGWDGGDPRRPFICDGYGGDSIQRIQLAGNTDAARKGDHADVGTLTLILTGTTALSGTYTDPDGTQTPVSSGSPITLKAKINEGSSSVGLG